MGAGATRPLAELLLVTIQALAYFAVTGLLVVGSGALSWADIGFRGSGRRIVEDVAWGAVFAPGSIAPLTPRSSGPSIICAAA